MKAFFPYYRPKQGRFIRVWVCWTYFQIGINFEPQKPGGYEISLLLPFVTVAWHSNR